MEILPDELCQEIFARLAGFYQCLGLVRPSLPRLDTRFGNFGLVHPSLSTLNEAIRAPFRIAATCSRWRALVLSSPELWAFAHAQDDQPADDVHLRMCIERSGQHPLDVWIHSGAEDWQRPPENSDEKNFDEEKDEENKTNTPVMFFEWLDLLQMNAHRWRRIRIDFPRPTPIDKFNIFTKPMPHLEELVLSTPSTAFDETMVNTEWDSDLNSQQLYFQNCSNLRSLASHATIMIPSVALSQLEYLSFSLRGLDDDTPLWAALAMTPALKELNIYYGYHGQYSSEPPPTPRHLPALRKLGLLGYFHFDQDWSQYLSVPNVNTLSVSIEPTNYLENTFATFSTTVRHLVITTVENGHSGGIFTRSDAEALASLQHVETLELRDIPPQMIHGVSEEFFACLAGVDDHLGNPLPKWGQTLRKIILTDCTLDIANCGSLAKLVGMRTTAASANASDAFELQLVNTKFVHFINDSSIPDSLGPVKHLFESSIVELDTYASRRYYSEDLEDSDEAMSEQDDQRSEFNNEITMDDASPQEIPELVLLI